jgi:hypothetical protein
VKRKPKWMRTTEWAYRFRQSADEVASKPPPADIHSDLWQAMQDSHRSEADRLENEAIRDVRETVQLALAIGIIWGLAMAELFHWLYP